MLSTELEKKGKKINLSFSQNIAVEVNQENYDAIYNELYDEFKKISLNVRETDNWLSAESINASFGSILRKDTSNVSVTKNRRQNGCVINCETVYKPSVAFWIIFCVIDFVLITTVIGFVLGFGATLGLYFYDKSLVEKAVKGALDNVKQNIG